VVRGLPWWAPAHQTNQNANIETIDVVLEI